MKIKVKPHVTFDWTGALAVQCLYVGTGNDLQRIVAESPKFRVQLEPKEVGEVDFSQVAKALPWKEQLEGFQFIKFAAVLISLEYTNVPSKQGVYVPVIDPNNEKKYLTTFFTYELNNWQVVEDADEIARYEKIVFEITHPQPQPDVNRKEPLEVLPQENADAESNGDAPASS